MKVVCMYSSIDFIFIDEKVVSFDCGIIIECRQADSSPIYHLYIFIDRERERERGTQ